MSEIKSKSILIRIEVSVLNSIKKAAQKLEMPVSEFIRNSAYNESKNINRKK